MVDKIKIGYVEYNVDGKVVREDLYEMEPVGHVVTTKYSCGHFVTVGGTVYDPVGLTATSSEYHESAERCGDKQCA